MLQTKIMGGTTYYVCPDCGSSFSAKKNLYRHIREKHNKEPVIQNVNDSQAQRIKDLENEIKDLKDELKNLKEKLAIYENDGKKDLNSTTELNSVPEEKPIEVIPDEPVSSVENEPVVEPVVVSEPKPKPIIKIKPVSSVKVKPVSSEKVEPVGSKEIKEKTGLETIPEETNEWKTMHFINQDGRKLMGLIKPKVECVGISGNFPEVQRVYSKKPETKSVIENLIGYLEKEKNEIRTFYIQDANRLKDCGFKLPEELSELSGCELYSNSNSKVDGWSFTV